MDPVTIWIFCLATAWFLRAAVEDGVAQLRGQESPRTTRSRVRQEFVRQHIAMTGQLPIRQAVAGRVAQRIANPRREIGPARRYLAGLWEDSWEDAATRHEERRRKREERRREQEQREREQAEREAAGRPDPDNALRTRPCLGRCGVLVVEPREWCDGCEARDADHPEEYDDLLWPDDSDVHYCAGGCGTQVGELGFWCMGCRYYRGPECAAGCGNKVAIAGRPCWTCIRRTTGQPPRCAAGCGRPVDFPDRACPECAPDRCSKCYRPAAEAGQLDEIGECPDCQRDTRDDFANQERLADLDDDQIDGLNNESPETPEPDPAPDTTRKETPPVTNPTEIDGDVHDPLTSLAFATGCLDTNTRLMNELDAMANNLAGEGVGDEVVQIVRDAWNAAEQFGLAALRARDEFARHVAVQAEIAGNTELRDTVRDTYLDTARA